MSDYIKREDAIKQIVKGEEMYGEEFATDTGRVKDFLNVLTSADVVEVVRCKDCKYYEWTSNRVPEEQTWWCYKHNTEMGNNDYCSYGERKDEK